MLVPTKNLAGMKCPKCGQNKSLDISATCNATVTDDGVTATEFEWLERSVCECRVCPYRELVADFYGINVSQVFCESALSGPTAHPRIGLIYALLRHANILRNDVVGLTVGDNGVVLIAASEHDTEQVPTEPVSHLDPELVASVLAESGLKDQTYMLSRIAG